MALTIGPCAVLSSGTVPRFNEHDKAYYAPAAVINFVRPGLALKILAANIADDGTITVRFRVTDPQGLPLDKDGVFTPGPVTVSFVAGYIPAGERQYRTYTTRVFTNPKGSVTDPWMDAGGTFTGADGEYVYTFAAKAPANFDRTVTHTIGGQAARNLKDFDLGQQADNDVFSFVPDGSPVTVTRDVVRTATCNSRCHDPLAVHGGNRRKVELCVICHQPQNQDPYGGTLSFPVMIHRIHRGADLPSVKAGKQLLVNNTNFSDVVFPAGVRNCEVCHDPNSGAKQADAWVTNPSRAACGACHDDTNFATGENHVNLPQISDNQCATCHFPQGETEFDASIRGAHLDPRFSKDVPGTTFEILKVSDGIAGKQPTVTFSVKDKTGNTIGLDKMNRLALVLAGPTADYAKAISEDATKAQPNGDGSYSYTFQNSIPKDASGTFSVGIEGYRNITLLAGTKKQQALRDAGINKVTYFAVDGSRIVPRRVIVDINKCNVCHLKLEMHGSNRNQTVHCVQCHNPNATDANSRPAAAMPAQTITFKTMIHRIHTGKKLQIEYSIYGFGGTANDFTDVVFPGDTRDCAKCHVNNSERLPLPDNLLDVVNPRGRVDPMGPISAACMGCHTSQAVAAHVSAMTTSIGESCAVCHGTGADYSIEKVHAR